MNIKKTLSDSAGFIIPALLIGLWILGAFHGKKKHNVDPFSSNFFVCWYYGLEVMWHKIDYKELNDDVKVAVFLIMSKPDNLDAKAQLEFNETKKDFKKVIDKLDKKELNYVKAGTNTFVDYTASIQKDMVKAFLDFKATKQFNATQSENSIALSKKCSSYGLDKEMQDVKTGLDELTKTFKEKYESDSESFDESLIDEEKMKKEMTQKFESIKKTFQEIFNE